MAEHVEARSLSALNHIAAHPPQYPINPTGRHETLTLYISRVPGCRDIILSTFKPQRKVVGGEDVANSLYYIHLDTVGDEMLASKAAHSAENATSRTSMESTRTQRIARKPLPSTARVPPLQEAPSDLTPAPVPDVTLPTDYLKYSPLNSSSHNKENVPLGGEEAAGAPETFPDSSHLAAQPPPYNMSAGSVVRKPLGPRALSPGPPSPGREYQAYDPTKAASLAKPSTPPPDDEARAALRSRPTPGELRLDNLSAQTFDDIRETRSPTIRSPTIRSPGVQSPCAQSRSPSPQSNQKPFAPFALSIIRRDPVTGHQWNIGKVSSFQSTIIVAQDPDNPDSPKIAQYPKGYPAINVHIETSGYARFRNFPTALPKMSDFPRMSLDNARPGSSGSVATTTRTMKELAASLQAQAEQHKCQDDTEEGFRRQVVMTYGKTWTSNLKEAFSGKKRDRSSTTTSATDSACNEPLDPQRAGFHRRQGSGNSTNSNDSMFASLVPNTANNDPNNHQQPQPQNQQQHHHGHSHSHSHSQSHNHNHHHNHHPQHHHHHQCHGSDASATSAAAAMAHPSATNPGKPDEPVIVTRPGAGLRPKGYTFASPWDGRCDFRTSSNGRALKCHHIRNTQSQGYNPLVAAQALRDAMPENNGGASGGGGGGGGGAGGGGRTRARGMSASLPMGDMGNRVPVSELRFNLPSSDLFNSKEDRDRAVAEMKEGLGRLLVRSPGGHEYDDDDEDKEEPIFDWSGLGKEKAGGGNRGKRAKLGKLLVHDEGLKMLDLVVAANMGIWWQAWERSF
ncbi:hypothetical protein DHEL01_v204310 [Diaporthe helianthi]|uniref:Uncharacterized protein n=1 Tax=Diaporthe helianthi TaxID=158607 RepID=A0A2P5I474_DIAHE|nr:hypothetical protein DHEL01_v204310 [Diaporthe helianthi]